MSKEPPFIRTSATDGRRRPQLNESQRQLVVAIVAGLGIVVVGFLLLLSVLGGGGEQGPPAPIAKYERWGGQGAALFIWIEPRYAKDIDAIKSVIRAVDDDRPICIIMLWSDKGMIPAGLPMSDEQLEAQVAQFNRNDITGLKKLVVGGKEVQSQ